MFGSCQVLHDDTLARIPDRRKVGLDRAAQAIADTRGISVVERKVKQGKESHHGRPIWLSTGSKLRKICTSRQSAALPTPDEACYQLGRWIKKVHLWG